MKFKQFEAWCNERACDGRWGVLEAMACLDLIDRIRSLPFWKRKKVWKEEYEQRVLDEIVNPINEVINSSKGEK